MKWSKILVQLIVALLGIIVYEQLKTRSCFARSTQSTPNSGENMIAATPQKVSKFTITEADANVTVASSDPTHDVMGNILSYKVPRHTKITLRPDDSLYMLLYDTTPTALAAGTPFELKLEDPNGIVSEIIRNGAYGEISTIGDNTKRFYLGVYREIADDYILKINAKSTTVTADASRATMLLTCLRTADVL